jgi:hypothetical protein
MSNSNNNPQKAGSSMIKTRGHTLKRVLVGIMAMVGLMTFLGLAAPVQGKVADVAVVQAVAPQPAAAVTARPHIYVTSGSWAGVTLFNEPCGQSYSNSRILLPGDSTDNHGWDCADPPGIEPFNVKVYDGGDPDRLLAYREYRYGSYWPNGGKIKFYNENDYVIDLI